MKKKKMSFVTTMFCLDCEHMWDASNVSYPCPKCASKQVIAASRWAPWASHPAAPVRFCNEEGRAA